MTLTANGTLTGTPNKTGNFTFTIKATDANGCGGTRNYSVQVACSTITVSPASLPTAIPNAPYNQTISATGGVAPYAYTFTGGLPNGLTLNANGTLSGTPVGGGVFTITVEATDANGCKGSQNYQLTVNGCGITLSPNALTNGTINTAYNQTFTATGSSGPYSFTSSALPPGLALSVGGILSGTPTQCGTFLISVKVKISTNCELDKQYSLTITGIINGITPGALPLGKVDISYSQQFTVTGGGPPSFKVSVGSLPPGLTLTAAGLLAGTPTQTGNFEFTIEASAGGNCPYAQTYLLAVQPRPVACVSAASYAGDPLAADSIVAAFGLKLATATQAAVTIPLPTTLSGTTVKITDALGVERLAPLFFVSPQQINLLIPAATASGAAQIVITSGNGDQSVGTIKVGKLAPGMFAANANGKDVAAALVLRIKSNGQLIYENIATFNAAQQKHVPLPIAFATPDEQLFLVLYGTGIRNHSGLGMVSTSIAGLSMQTTYAGPVSSLVGLDQVNVRLSNALIGKGLVNIVFTADGKTANTVQVLMQ